LLVRKAIEYAVQIAKGLAAAPEKGMGGGGCPRERADVARR